jgi:ribosomal-protein-alanine N-acetyltransferase
MITEFHKQGSAFYLRCWIRKKKRSLASLFQRGAWVISRLLSRVFHRSEMARQGLMFEALTTAIRYMQRTQHIHRIMANYMPHNQRSGNLLARLGSRKRLRQSYLLIDGNGVTMLTALTTPDWTAGR